MKLDRRGFLLSLPALAGGLSACASGGPLLRAPWRGWDVAIIGSGFAGTYLATTLAERGFRTVMVEAGGEVTLKGDRLKRDGDKELFPLRAAGSEDYPITRSRTIGVGGTSAKWTGIATRLFPSDLKEGSRFGIGADWPLVYDELDPHYCTAEKLLRVHGSRAAEGTVPPRGCPLPHERKGYTSPAPAFAGRDLRFAGVPRSRREGGRGAVRLAETEIRRFESMPNTALLSDKPVTRIVTTDGRSIDHIEMGRPGERVERLHARVFVVAAGTFESARLLLASTSRWHPEGLGNQAGLVGRNLGLHPSHDLVFEEGRKGALPEGIHRSHTYSDRFRSEKLSACHFQVQVGGGRWSLRAQPQLEPRVGNGIFLDSSETDPFGRPGASLRVALSRRDENTMAVAKGIRNELAETLGLTLAAGREASIWRYHPSGTCRMAASDGRGVVDPDLRVFGTRNLYVSGASVFPTSGTANPTLTVVALTLRLAAHLSAELERAI